MMENEAIKELSYDNTAYGGRCTEKVRRVAIHALSEIQQYRAIGTVEDIQEVMALCKSLQETVCKYMDIGTIEEFKALKEKSVAKKPKITSKVGNAEYTRCLHCNLTTVLYDKMRPIHCPNCGGNFDWSE